MCGKLQRHAAAAVPTDMAEACQTYLEACQAGFTAGLHELRLMLDALDRAGVRAVPFKGPGLAIATYPNPTLRRFRDLDLLIRPADLEPALTVLMDLGYRSDVDDLSPGRRRAYHQYNGQDILFAPDRLPIEPHWMIAPRTFSAELDVDTMMARSVTVDAPGVGRLPGLAPEDTLLVAALHGGKEQWARLIWIIDLAAIFATWPALDAAAVLDRATACGCRRMLLLAVMLARDLVGADPPALLVRQALSDKAIPGLVADVTRRLPLSSGEAPSVFQVTRFRWRLRERRADRARYLMRTLLTARVPHFRTLRLPENLAFLYPAVRIGRDALAVPLWQAWKRGRGWHRARA